VVSRSTLERAISMVRGYVIPALRYTLAEFTGDSFDIWVQGWLLYHCAGKTAVTLSEVKRGARRRMEKVQSILLQDRMVIGAMQTLEEAGLSTCIRPTGRSTRPSLVRSTNRGPRSSRPASGPRMSGAR